VDRFHLARYVSQNGRLSSLFFGLQDASTENENDCVDISGLKSYFSSVIDKEQSWAIRLAIAVVMADSSVAVEIAFIEVGITRPSNRFTGSGPSGMRQVLLSSRYRVLLRASINVAGHHNVSLLT
jgi:hypothetical protein